MIGDGVEPLFGLTDPWGSAAGDFALNELDHEEQLRRRFHELIGDMIMHARGAAQLIELRDAFVTAEQLEQLRLRLGAIPEIQRARVRLHNQVRFLPERPDRYLVTDFAIEVNQPFERTVREVAEACEFRLRDDPWLIQRKIEALLRLVDQHRRDGQPNPDFALCFQLQDRDTDPTCSRLRNKLQTSGIEVSKGLASRPGASFPRTASRSRSISPIRTTSAPPSVQPNPPFLSRSPQRQLRVPLSR